MFTLFPNLPTEVRLLIWELCLPRRVVEESPAEIFQLCRDCECPDPGATRRSSEPPVILSVCREAARVARENGSMVSRDSSYLSGPTWIQPGRDRVVHKNSHESSWRSRCTPGAFFELTRSLGMEPSLMAYHLVPVRLENLFTLEADDGYPAFADVVQVTPEGSPASSTAKQLVELETAGDRLILVPLVCISLHIPRAAALASGLFGLLGDEPVQLVDAGDHARLKRYSDLIRDHSTLRSKRTARLRRILYEFCDATEVPGRLREWQAAAEWLLLAHMWRRDRAVLLEADPLFEETESLQQQEFDSAWTPSYSREGMLVQGVHQVNETSAWVVQARKRMWRPKPQVMIRLCRGEEY